MPLDHAEGVGIGPESSLWIKPIKELPVCSDVFALEVVNVDWVEQYFKFNDLIPEFWCKSYVYNSLLILFNIFIGNCPLFNEVTALVCNIFVQFTILSWQRIIGIRQENIGAFGIFKFYEFGFTWVFWAIRIQNLLLISKVLFQSDTKTLLQFLVAILIIKEHLPALSEARNGELRSCSTLVGVC